MKATRTLSVSSLTLKRTAKKRHNKVPYIILKGNWLAEAGIEIGDSVFLTVSKGQIIISPRRTLQKIA